MATINLNKLIADRKPVVELELDEKIYPIYEYEQLSVGVTARVTEVNANIESIADEVNRAIEIIQPQINELEVTRAGLAEDHPERAAVDAKISRLYSARIAQESRLLRPTRELIEALGDLPSGSLDAFPPLVLNKVFEEIKDKVFAKLAKKTEPESPETVAS
jgi:hypothetical protein